MHCQMVSFKATRNPYPTGCTHDKLGLGICLQNPGEDISNEVHTLLQRPTSHEDEQFGFRVFLETSPFLSLALEVCPACLEFLIDGRGIGGECGVLAPFGSVLKGERLVFDSQDVGDI